MIRECYKCKENKEFNYENFPANKSKPNGLDTICRVCSRKSASLNQKNNRERCNLKRKRLEVASKLSGKCIKCKDYAIENTYSFCEKHFLKYVSLRHSGTATNWKYLKQLLESQNNKCFYSGIDLILGQNASIDHIKSKSKYPELKHDINNLQWVDIKVNLMKRESNEDYFLELIDKIHMHSVTKRL